ncbi:hypothetical protein CYMTET_25237 [Cymbomonas tetramitiformis]|uniref:Ion transport domain-containing protein n=1 Tax=Cymbomonas tetramitiformis TaxID=36881 RepID=A0AAE0KZE5_9CHLO|nr:hypothetical protein CYMTET_25237 [Cymbomonas tetramitiformis]|eukprot:gene13594-16075_t
MAAVVIAAKKRAKEEADAREELAQENENFFSNSGKADGAGFRNMVMPPTGISSTSPVGTPASNGEPAKEAPRPEDSIFYCVLQFRQRAQDFYTGTGVQVFVACLIFLNFIVNAVEAQIMDKEDEVVQMTFQIFEYFFTVVFTAELVLNMYAFWFFEFFQSGWNWFDFIVVSIGLITLFVPSLPGVTTLRLMRAFRVFRLFKRLESLRKIINALEAALPGCANAFSILVLISSIYAILGVEFFAGIHPDRDYFKNFSAAFFTLFQVMTGDSWAENVARPIIDQFPQAAIYFVSYILISAIVLVNVVVAVLLEKMVSEIEPEDAALEDPEEGERNEDPKYAEEEVELPEGVDSWHREIVREFNILQKCLNRLHVIEAELVDQEQTANLPFVYEPEDSEVLSPATTPGSEAGIIEMGVTRDNSEVDLGCTVESNPLHHMPRRQAVLNKFQSFPSILIKLSEPDFIETTQQTVYEFYNSTEIQVGVASLIFLNFLQNAVEAQLVEPSKVMSDLFGGLELFFTVIFTLELVLNMYAHWFWAFWSSGWNWFDFTVVMISLISLGMSDMDGVSTLRLMRAFRVFRLFKRLESLRKILKALEDAVPGCANAFSILILVTAIYAILGVEFFSDASPYYFDRFSSAFFSLIQVMTGDSWAEAVARPIIDIYPHAALYFMSYILIAGIMLMNVVIAVLLEKMSTVTVSVNDEDDESEFIAGSKEHVQYVKRKEEHAQKLLELKDEVDSMKHEARASTDRLNDMITVWLYLTKQEKVIAQQLGEDGEEGINMPQGT